VTKRLVEAGHIMCIEVIDHLILATYQSLVNAKIKWTDIAK